MTVATPIRKDDYFVGESSEDLPIALAEDEDLFDAGGKAKPSTSSRNVVAAQLTLLAIEGYVKRTRVDVYMAADRMVHAMWYYEELTGDHEFASSQDWTTLLRISNATSPTGYDPSMRGIVRDSAFELTRVQRRLRAYLEARGGAKDA